MKRPRYIPLVSTAKASGQHYDEDRVTCIVGQDLHNCTKPCRISFAVQELNLSCKG
jgi:hypothetical protein